MIRLWREYLEEAKRDDGVNVIIVTGVGDTFCSGGDIRDMAEGKLRSWNMKRLLWDGVHRIIMTLENLDKPVIAAINGTAMGARMDMAIMCDRGYVRTRQNLANYTFSWDYVPVTPAHGSCSGLSGLRKPSSFFSRPMSLVPANPCARYRQAASSRMTRS